MGVAVMHVGIMRVSMDQRLVDVRVGVRFASVPGKIVRMSMVLVVRMGMRVLLPVVCMHMHVMFGKVQPDARGHQHARCD